MKVRITYYGASGTIYSEIEEYDDCDDIEIGFWQRPFPNEKGNSMAFGLEECIAQSERCPLQLREEGISAIRVAVERGSFFGRRMGVAEILEEIRGIANFETLPDGDSVNVSTALWAEDCINRLKDAKGENGQVAKE